MANIIGARTRQTPSDEPVRTPAGGGGGSGSKLPGVPGNYKVRAPRRRDQPNWRYSPTMGTGLITSRPGIPGLADTPGSEMIGPRYQDGDQFKPVGTGAGGIAELKRRMVMAGYLDIDDVGGLSIWNEDAVKAYQAALVDANRMGLDVNSLLMQAAMEGGGAGNTGGGRGGSDGGGGGGGGWVLDENGNLVPSPADQFVPEALNLQLPNRDDLRKVFRGAVIDKLGEGWNQETIEDLVDTYIWKYMAVQTDAYAQMIERDRQIFETGTSNIKQITEVAPQSAEGFIEEEAKKRDPGGVQATDVAEDYAPAFFEALGGLV